MRQLCVDLQQLKHCARLESLTKMHKLRRQRHFYIYLLFFFVDVDQNVCVGCAHFKNSSSWVLYNMASFYWRMKNEPQKAVDCVVRALHFSPRYRRARAEATGRCNLLIESGSSQVFRRILTLCVCVRCISRQQKDVALVNMANVLHRAHFSADAAILAHAALDLTTDLFTSHYTLGNIYAVS